ncbi:hypothetical protein LRS73_35605 (plasmid) [Methylobacterium currus]|uniref:hypothetical protein n=1 Tax=Methylobacterium currus TaxID=2051553 RepID=UPI001E4A0A4C|nr:hypothetical protein [Methylobacterium currus]UHC20460.1 hypothetical protein LRS73_35605 [Methylobacterium currus]
MPLSLKLPRRPRQTLRERFAATREKYARTLKANRALSSSPKPTPIDRVALVNYATWLYLERQLVCAELYPHMGSRAASLVMANNAADRFHFPVWEGGLRGIERAEKPSARAVRVLDMVGVAWREDLPQDRRDILDPPEMRDTGARPALPYGWPTIDAELVAAVSDLRRLDSLTETLLRGLPEDRDPETVPGYIELESARQGVLAALSSTRADGLPGLQAKAKALQTEGVVNDPETTSDLARSICRDLTGARSDIVEPQPDPVHAVIEEGERLLSEWLGLLKTKAAAPHHHPSHSLSEAAIDAVWLHWRERVLTTVPRTAEGCRALARHAIAFTEQGGANLEGDTTTLLGLIARSPLL